MDPQFLGLQKKALQILQEAEFRGALTPEETRRRMDLIPQAENLGDLERLIEDLLGHDTGTPEPAGANLVVLDKRTVGPADLERPMVTTLLGKVVLDLAELAPGSEVRLECATILGKTVVTVPPGVRVVNRLAIVLGKVQVEDRRGPETGTLVLTGAVVCGKIRVIRSKKTEFPKIPS